MSTKKPPGGRKAKAPSKAKAKAKAAPERQTVGKLRTLGDVGGGATSAPKRTGVSAARAKEARALLEQEFHRVLEMKEKLAAEAAIGGKEKGRQALRQEEKLRSLIASLEGMSRFALKLGLITPAENRTLYAQAMKEGLYDGWR